MDTSTSNTPSMVKYAATYGLILGLAIVLLNVIDYVGGFYGQSRLLSVLNYVIMIGGVTLFTTLYRNKALGGYITYGNAVGFGILLCIFATVISGVFQFILNLVDPSYIAKQMEIMADQLYQTGLYSDQMIEQMLQTTRFLKNPLFILLGAVLAGALAGTIISLITSIFIQKKKSIF